MNVQAAVRSELSSALVSPGDRFLRSDVYRSAGMEPVQSPGRDPAFAGIGFLAADHKSECDMAEKSHTAAVW